MTDVIAVYLELGAKKAFASALDWPGWSRGGRGEEAALEALVAYAPRYARVADRAGLEFTPPTDLSALEIVERIPGNATTEFGVPALPARDDSRELDERELDRQRRLLEGAWAVFDLAAKKADGVELRKGPRGGGRDLDKIIDHVVGAEESYLVQLGGPRNPAGEKPRARATHVRGVILDTLTARARGEPVEGEMRARRLWPPRYFVRRAAWHVLDHAWEIEDRVTQPAG